ncbi:MAG: HAMP domain-containing sensor histidine kinase [Anaerolineae bacterium]
MNRLWVQLTLAFFAVTLITVAVVSVLAGVRADVEFRRYLDERDQQNATATNSSTTDPSGQFPANGQVNRPNGGQVFGPQAGRAPFAGRAPLPAPELEFIARLQGVLVIAAVAAGATGVVLGFIISRAITAPLSHLSVAARDFASHRWDRRVPVTGSEEIADVARAFNEMADSIQHSDQLRRNLMADIAHELRTPLTVMQGNLRALLDGVYPLELKEVATLYDETRLLSRLVADLRELALAEAGQFPLNLQTVSLTDVLNKTAEQFTLAAEVQNTKIEVVYGGPPTVKADPDRLAQVLHNLVANALRYTANGRISVSGERAANDVRIRVTDTGTGIDPADLPHIFDRFYRGDESRPGSNTGLGLAIAKAWVEAMGGHIGVDSVSGSGTSFWFTLQASN